MFLCFFSLIALIFPLFNFQSAKLTNLEGISEIYLVFNVDGKQDYVKQDDVDIVDLQESEGVILIFDKTINDVKKLLNFKLTKCENIDGMEILYGYSNLYSDFIYIDGKQSNVQLVKKGGKTVAGFPLILSGF